MRFEMAQINTITVLYTESATKIHMVSFDSYPYIASGTIYNANSGRSIHLVKFYYR